MNDIFRRPIQKNIYESELKYDLREEEAAFIKSIPSFREMIKFGNETSENTMFVYVPDEDKKNEEKPEKVIEIKKNVVELTPVKDTNGVSKDVSNTKPYPEYIVSDLTDDLDFTSSKNSKPETKNKEKELTAEDVFGSTNTKSSDFSIFDEDPPVENKKEKISVSETTKKENVAINQVDKINIKQIDEAENHPINYPVGWDIQMFEAVNATINRMLKTVPDVDLDTIKKNMPEYVGKLNIDYMRDDPNILNETILEIQAKRDTLYSQVINLTSAFHKMKHAANYLEEVGIDCSSASSREKRLSQLKYVTANFWVRWAEIESVSKGVEKSFEHLNGQYECVSRLITAQQHKNKVADISRGEMPYFPPAQHPTVKLTPVAQVQNKKVEEPKEHVVTPQIDPKFKDVVAKSDKFVVPSNTEKKKDGFGFVDF